MTDKDKTKDEATTQGALIGYQFAIWKVEQLLQDLYKEYNEMRREQ